MQKRLILILSAFALLPAAGHAAASSSGAAGELMARAKYWEGRGRDDLARDALKRILLISADDPDALAEMGILDARSGNLAEARTMLDHLKSVAPKHAAILHIEDLLRINGPDKDKLRQARLLASSGRKSEALAKFRELFPNGPPDGEIALEYWQLVSAAPQGFGQARDGLEKLARNHPENLKYRLALAKLEVTRPPLDRRALNVLVDFSKMPEYEREAKAAWRGAMLRFGDDPANIPLLKTYLSMDPQDTAVRQQLDDTLRSREKAERALEEKNRLQADPYYQEGQAGLTLLGQGKLDEAEVRLVHALSGRPEDAELLGAMGLLRFRQGRYFEAQGCFMKAMKLDPERSDKWIPLLKSSRFWGYMKEYHDASAEPLLARMKLRQALAVDPDQPDALAALGHVLYDNGNAGDAEKAYRKALGFQATNVSALAGLVTLYLKTGRPEDARKLLDSLDASRRRSLGSGYASLRSGLLRQEADRLVESGDLARAEKKLEEATGIDPSDPWLRYDLAKLYIRRNEPDKAKSLLAGFANDASGHYAHALLLSSLGEDEAALAEIDKISVMDEKTASFRKRLMLAMDSRKAKTLFGSGDSAGATTLLIGMERTAKGDPDLETDVAYAWADIGNISHALEMLDGIERTDTLPASWHLRYANLLNSRALDERLSRELARIASLQHLGPDDAVSFRKLGVSLAARRSEALRKAGKPEEAENILKPYIRQNPDDTRLLLEETGIMLDLNRPATAEENYRHVLASEPGNSDALEGLAALLLKSGRTGEAEKFIAGLADAQKKSLGNAYNSLRSNLLRQQADALLARGDRTDAARRLEQAMTFDPENPWLRFDFAKLRLLQNDWNGAKSLFDDYLARHPEDPDGLYAYALLLSSRDEEGSALAVTDRIPVRARSKTVLAFRKKLVETIAIRESASLSKAGRTKEAGNKLAPLLAEDPESAPLLLAKAGIELDGKRFQAAEADYRQILARQPENESAREGLADTLIDEGRLLDALNQVRGWLAGKQNTPMRLKEAGILIDLEDYPGARKTVDMLLAADPGNGRALAYAREIDAHENPALRPYPVAKLMQDELPPWLKQKQPEKGLSKSEAEALDEAISWVSAAADVRTRSGTPGESRVDSVEIPLEWRTPLKTGGQAFFRMDAVKLDAGTAAPDAKSFGTDLLCVPNCPSAAQSAKGASFTIGYAAGGDLRLDIGTTPLGFPVRHVLGGILKKGDLGPFSYSVDLSRRPVTSTLLSYAGTQDPRTGLTWGGVVATGPRLGLSLDSGGPFGFWSSFEYHKLTGENVQSNTAKRWMAGGYWRAINEDDMELKLGLTGMYWRYAVDAGEFSFGHGGYYSPQRYASLSLPVSFGQKISNFSYVLRASVSTSRSSFDAAPYFPTSQGLQAQGNNTYTPSSGPGHGYSLLADWEYLVSPELYVGGQFDIERSVYYAPNHMLIYLRHPVGGKGAQRVFLPPETFEPTSQF